MCVWGTPAWGGWGGGGGSERERENLKSVFKSIRFRCGLLWTEDAAKCMSFPTITHQCGRAVTDVSKISALVVIIIICFLNFYEDFVQMSINQSVERNAN